MTNMNVDVPMKTGSELAFEAELIDYLTQLHGERQWEYVPEIKTTEALWANFKKILEQNNRAKLDEPYLSTTEFNQIKKVISGLDTPYKAGQFLYGVNGVSEIEVDLDSGRHVFLTVFDQALVGTGGTVYQVVNQIERPRVIDGRQNRRFDVTLLINGLPIIQIELKKNWHNVREAFNQMKQYATERQYGDIFSTLQILVGMTPFEMRYMANVEPDKWNNDFVFQWQDEETAYPVHAWKEFVSKVLSIPAAHNLATRYMILDGTPNKEAIKVMRPYQVYATKRVLDEVAALTPGDDGRLGYIWHTTGSGKTITSFKTAWLASRLPNIDKVVFLVDRIALTNQTVEKYRAYDPVSSFAGKTGVVSDTANVSDLRKKLVAKSDSNIIVTSIQKMARYVKRKDFKKPVGQILFIVDEAHRSTGDGTQTGDGKTEGMLADIRQAIPESGWVGYTGTPRVVTKAHGAVDRNVTEEIFGKQLHAYTIREAIADGNVLGFQAEFKDTIPDEKPDNPTIEEWDDNVRASVYDDSSQHLAEVVDDIYTNWSARSKNWKYNGLLTVHVGGGKSSIPRALEYFRAFMAKNEEQVHENERRVSRGHKPIPLLKVAVTFSLDTTNSDEMTEKNTGLLEAIQHYNSLFGTSFGLDEVREYTADVASRLNKTADDSNYLDLLIVVDQFLTGFDAPELNTLYVDRTLKGANLIQAYSRTNRVHDMVEKPQGLIVNYRWPQQNEEEMNRALAIYSNRDALEVSTLSLDDLRDRNQASGVLAKGFVEVTKRLREVVSKLSDMTENFRRLPSSERAQDEMYDAIREYNCLMSQVKQFTEDGKGNPFSGTNPSDLEKHCGVGFEEENLLRVFAMQLRERKAKREEIDVSQIPLTMVHVNDVEINYDYLTDLLADMAEACNNGDVDVAQAKHEEVEGEISKIENVYEREQWSGFARDILNGDMRIEPPVPREAAKMRDLKDEHIGRTNRRKIAAFLSDWGVIDTVKTADLEKWFTRHRMGDRDDLDKQGELSALMMKAKDDYGELAASEEVRALSWIAFRRAFREALYELADDIVRGA